jgi:NhaC family Na+:H+ antiporter
LAATLGVPTLSFLPYAVFNFVSPLLVIVFAFTGLRMMHAPTTTEESSIPRQAAGGNGG